MNILVIGESCKDIFHYGDCRRLCPEAPVPVFNSSRLTQNGGMATNVYNNIISLGSQASLHTNDNYQDITKTRFVDERTNHMFMRLDKNDNQYGFCDLRGVDFTKYDAVVVSDYNKGFLSTKDLEYISNSHDVTFLDTKRALGDWCNNFSYIKINVHEFEKSAHLVNDSLIKKIIITLGRDGCRYQDNLYSVPLVEVKDASGAGDTFVASLAVKYCETRDIQESIIFANQVSTMVVQKLGVATL